VAEAAAPVATGVDVNALSFRYRIEGDAPPWVHSSRRSIGRCPPEGTSTEAPKASRR
jgi:hypothetical protein